MTLSLSSSLFHWSAKYGPMPIVGGRPVHTRNSAAVIDGQAGQLYTAIVNTPRFGWDTIAGTRRQTLLLEAARTNILPYSEDFSSWASALNTTISSGQADPFGGTAARLLNGTVAGNNDLRAQTTTFSGNGTKAYSVFLKAGTAALTRLGIYDSTAGATRGYVAITWIAGVPVVTPDGGAPLIYPPVAIGNGWYWIRVSAQSVVAANVNNLHIYPAYTGAGTVYAFGAQVEDAIIPSSYIKTTVSPATRAADSFYFDQCAPSPQAMMAYIRFVEQGGALATSHTPMQVGGLAGSSPQFGIFANGSAGYSVIHANGASAVSAGFFAAPNLPNVGQVVELIAILRADGSVLLLQSLDGGAVASSGYSGALSLASAWFDNKVVLNQNSTAYIGQSRFADVKIVKYADVVATTNQGIMDELRGFEFGPNGGLL